MRLRERWGAIGQGSVGIISAAVFVWSPTAAAECGDGILDLDTEDCDVSHAEAAGWCTDACKFRCETSINDGATGHTCQHATSGPFGTRSGQAYPGVITTEIGQTHVYFTISMARNEANEVVDTAVYLFPTQSGELALYLGESATLTLLDDEGQALEPIYQTEIETCLPGLTRAQIYDLSVDETYIVLLDAAGPASRSVVLEAMRGHARTFSIDNDGDGFGQPEPAAFTWCNTEGTTLVEDNRDCDDTRATVHPDAPELCDGLDNNCDGQSEEEGEVCQPTTDETSSTGETTHTERERDAGYGATFVGSVSQSSDGGRDTPGTGNLTLDAETRVDGSDTEPGTTEVGTSAASNTGRPTRDSGPARDTSAAEDRPTAATTDGAGCGCAIVGGRSSSSALLGGLLGALMILSCGLRRRVTGG